MNRRPRLGLDDDPCLGLALSEPERVARDRAAGVEMDGQALAGVQQLDQERRIGAEAPYMLLPEPRLRLGSYRIAD